MSVYYNEIDAYAAQWLRNLISKNLIAKGDVDARSICDVDSDDIKMYRQCHFFAGIGGWSHALRLAGWSDDRPIWTGSCPCQPFSVAGKGTGIADPRHLWPDFHRLIAACRPPVVMGEQVAGKAGYGWLDGVRADLEREGYASRGVDIPACSVDAPHIRQRLYWVATDLADAGHMRGRDRPQSGQQELSPPSGSCAATVALVNSASERLERHGKSGSVAESSVRQTGIVISGEGCSPVHMADAMCVRRQGPGPLGEPSNPAQGRDGQTSDAFNAGSRSNGGSFWSNYIWLTGADGKSRRSKPGLPLLAHGVSNRVGRLRAYGNAIVPPLAAEVIKAFMECEP
jgi:DNA (cytosine-5)-methyltransferase 1